MASKNKNAPEGADSEDQSMEDILQSIRRIIADEEGGSDDVTTEETNDAAEEVPATEPAVDPVEEEEVLILTDEVPEEAAPAEEAPAEGADAIEFDKLFGDDPLMTEGEGEQEEPAVAAAEAEEPAIAPESFEEMPAMAEEPNWDAEPGAEDSLVSDATAAATIEALQAIKAAGVEKAIPAIESQAFRSGVTVEDLVVEALRPMLKEWLDGNLPTIVEHIVQKEVRKLVAAMRD